MANGPNLEYAQYVPPPPFRRLRALGLGLSLSAIMLLVAEFAMRFHWLPWDLQVAHALRLAAILTGVPGVVTSFIAWVRNYGGAFEILALLIAGFFSASFAVFWLFIY
jgi:hypothetical protein